MKRALSSILSIIAMLMVVGVLGINAVISYRNTQNLSLHEKWVQHTQTVISQLQGILADVTNATAAQRGLLITGDLTFRDPVETARKDSDERIRQLIQLTIDNPDQQKQAIALRDHLNAVWQGIDADAGQPLGKVDADALKERVRQSRLANDIAHADLANMEGVEHKLLAQRQAESKASLRYANVTFAVATIVAIGTVLLAFGLVLNSERRRTRYLREQAKLSNYNRLLIESTGEGMFGVDLEGKCTFLNKAGEKALGVTASDVIGKPMHDLTHYSHADGSPYPAQQCPIYRSFRDGVGCRVDDEVFFRGNGESFPVEYSAFPIRTDHGTVEGAVVTFNDITARKRAEELFRESSERFRTLTDHMAQLAWMANGKGSIVWFNQRWFDYTGSTQQEMGGLNWQKAIDPEYAERVLEKYRRAVENGEVWEDSFPLRAKDGTYRWFLSRAIPIRNESGAVIRYFGTNTDTTEQRQIEEALRESRQHLQHAKDDAEFAREQAEAANIAKSQFLANMSHELRTPLNAVIMYAELLQEEAEDRNLDGFIPDLDKIRNAGKHLLALVNGVLDLSKIEAGKMDLYLETFDIAGMVKDVVTTVEPLIQKRSNKLEMDLPADLGEMHSDLTKVRQILFNLLSNASKFTEKGVVRVEAHCEAATDSDAGWTIFRVTDNGIGMTPEQLGKLFQPFTQADASTTRKFGGTGLGLAISKRFAEMMGGQITALSEPEKGSVFELKLPARVTKPAVLGETSSAAAVQQAAIEHPGGVSAGTTILVVDDEPAIRDLISRTLMPDGVRVITAADGEAGLRQAKLTKPNLIFLDVMMPRMDGWAVLTALKADPETADIPVIMLTIVNEADMGYVLGASEYLTKPIDRDRLTGVLGKYMVSGKSGEVLVVEDDDPTREVIRRSLSKQGWAVTETPNGRIALDQMHNRAPALILLDLMMPEMDGFEFLVALRSNPAWRSIPVVVLTSKDLTSQERAWLTGKVERIVQKGTYSRDALLSEVRKIVADCAVPPAAQSAGGVADAPATNGTAENVHAVGNDVDASLASPQR